MVVRVLDCTLRDGGYVNSWDFGYINIENIVKNLVLSEVDFIELGFLKPCQYNLNKTLFNRMEEFNNFVTSNVKTQFLGMITYGQYEVDDIPLHKEGMIDGVRIIFKPTEYKKALEYCMAIKNKGYKVFINPMHTYNYSDKELLDLIEKANEIKPYGVSIVDTMGIMKAKQLLHIFNLIDYNLSLEIGVCFHSHNNLQLSFSNAQALIEANSRRELIIDVSIRGMGRGAGNLCTELLLQYLNDGFEKKYNLIPILKTIDEQINKIYIKHPWGYNISYYLAASLQVHPNYASFLTDKASISVESMSDILSLIPDNKKSNFDEKLIQELYLKYQENEVDDSKVLDKLKSDIADKKILVVAPGKTIIAEHEKINNYIKQNNPFIISINFRPQDIAVNNVFIGNARRFSEQTNLKNVIVTSNIKTDKVSQLNYGSYLNNSEMADNSALMLLKILIKLGAKEVVFAGLDGFSSDKDNYFSLDMVNNAKLGEEFDKRNDIMSAMLKKLSRQIGIKFITTSLYEN